MRKTNANHTSNTHHFGIAIGVPMKAHELLSDSSKWTTKYAARNESDQVVGPSSPDACKFCVYGALQKCYPGNYEPIRTIRTRLNLLSLRQLFKWNDSSTFEQVRSTLLELDI